MPLRSCPSRVRPLPARAGRRRPLSAWLVGAVTAAGLISACTRPADPSGTTTTTTTSSAGSSHSSSSSSTVTSARPTSSPPTSSAPNDDQLAIQAVERYYAAFNAALKTLRTDQMRKEFFPGCLICEQDADTIDSVAIQGRTHVGGDARMDSPIITSRQATRIVVQATVVAERLILKDASGRIVKDEARVVTLKSFFIVKTDGRWILEGMT